MPSEAVSREFLVRSFLQDHFSAPISAGLNTSIEMRFTDHSIFCRVTDGELTFPHLDQAELVLYIPSPELAQRLFSGEITMADAFLQGKLRSNGHLVQVFHVLAVFTRQEPG